MECKPCFIRSIGNVVGPSVLQMVKSSFISGTILPGINFTLLTLIPKVFNPESMNQFRPISLCNVSTKIKNS